MTQKEVAERRKVLEVSQTFLSQLYRQQSSHLVEEWRQLQSECNHPDLRTTKHQGVGGTDLETTECPDCLLARTRPIPGGSPPQADTGGTT